MTTPERSPSTVRNIVAALRALIGFGELRGWVHVNPCKGLRLPAGEQARERIATPTEAATLIAAMWPKDQASLGLAVYAGLRLGELLALDVSAVDLAGGWIHVRRSWDPGAKQFVPPKSRKPRKVPIIDKLAKLLANHFVLLDHPSDGLLFPSAKNAEWPTDPAILRRRICKQWDDAGLDRLGFHEGRHTFASIGIAAGLNAKTLSTYLGHATITITLDRYGHLMPGSEVEARAMLDAYLDRPQN
jgi:integrase